jgi:hypothetical protein
MYEITYSNLDFFEIHLNGFLKNPGIFLKKCQKCVKELKFCMNELFNNVFKALLHFKISRSLLWILLKKIASSQYVESLHALY